MKHNILKSILLSSALLVITAAAAQTKPAPSADMVTVVPMTGSGWFNRMEEGVNAFSKTPEAKGRTTAQSGPLKVNAADQIKLIDELLAGGKVKALAVMPSDVTTIESTLKKAIDKGIQVVTHEAETLRHTHADVKAFSDLDYGARLNERMALCMKGEGKWTVFVGSINHLSNVKWAEGGINNAARRYPKMQLVDAKQESANSAEQAYVKTKEVLNKYPDIKGFQGSSQSDVLGIGRAIQEAGLQDKTCVFGTGLPSESNRWISSGAIDGLALWDPKNLALAMHRVATMLLDDQPITYGADLGVPGYRQVLVGKGPGLGVIIVGQAWLEIDRNNIKTFPF